MRLTRNGKLFLGLITSTTLFTSGGFFAGSEQQADQNWKGETLINIPETFNESAKNFLFELDAETIELYYYDYREPTFIKGIAAYGNDKNFIPIDQYASRIDPRFMNDFRNEVSYNLNYKSDTAFNTQKEFSEFSSPIPVRDLVIPAGRIVLKFDRVVTDGERINIEDKLANYALWFRK